MITFSTILRKFGANGEKTGWTYIDIPAIIAEELNKAVRKSYRVKGRLDQYPVKGVALVPMGAGDFIMPVNTLMRKQIGKKEGAVLEVSLELDTAVYELNALLVEGITASPSAGKKFYQLPRSHQHYYSKWIESAKMESTRQKRVVQTVVALERGLSYAELLRELKAEKKQ